MKFPIVTGESEDIRSDPLSPITRAHVGHPKTPKIKGQEPFASWPLGTGITRSELKKTRNLGFSGLQTGVPHDLLVREDADFLREAQENGTEVRFPKDPEENIGGSAFAEMFPAGTKRLVLLRWGKPMFNTDPGQAIPVVSRDWLRSALLDARAKAEGREAPAQ